MVEPCAHLFMSLPDIVNHEWTWKLTVIKMDILLKLLYTFQMVPIAPPSGFFTCVNTLIRNYIWQHKNPRIHRFTFFLPKSRGWVDLPHILTYSYTIKHLAFSESLICTIAGTLNYGWS